MLMSEVMPKPAELYTNSKESLDEANKRLASILSDSKEYADRVADSETAKLSAQLGFLHAHIYQIRSLLRNIKIE